MVIGVAVSGRFRNRCTDLLLIARNVTKLRYNMSLPTLRAPFRLLRCIILSFACRSIPEVDWDHPLFYCLRAEMLLSRH